MTAADYQTLPVTAEASPSGDLYQAAACRLSSYRVFIRLL